MSLQFDGSGTWIGCGTDPKLRGDVFTIMASIFHSGNNDNPIMGGTLSSAKPAIYSRFSGGLPVIYLDSDCYRAFNGPPPANQWSHVAFTVPGNTAAEIVNSKYYLNGVLQTVNGTISTGDGANKSRLLIGRAGSNYSDDIIAEKSYWNRVLSQKEIQYYRHRKLSGGESGLVGYWPIADAGAGLGVPIKDLCRSPHIVLLDGCEEEDWANLNEASPETVDAVNFKAGAASLSLGKTGVAGIFARYSKTSAVIYNGTGLSCYVWFRVNDKILLNVVNGIYLRVGSDTANFYSMTNAPASLQDIVNDATDGWNKLGGPLPWATKTGSPDITQMDLMEAVLYTPSAAETIPHGDINMDWWHLQDTPPFAQNGIMEGFAGNPWKSGPPVMLRSAA